MKHLFFSVLVCLSLQVTAQCLLREIPLAQRTVHSSLILEGRVINKHSFWNDAHTMIYTSNTVEVLKLFKGSLSDSTIEILTEGGIVGLQMIKADPSLNLQKDDVGVFLCETPKHFKGLSNERSSLSRYEAYGSVQGFIKYDTEAGTAADPFHQYNDVEEELYQRLSPTGNFREFKSFSLRPAVRSQTQSTLGLTGFSPSTIIAGTGAVLTINGSGFGATRGTGVVGFKNADDGGATYITPLPSEYISWSDNQIMVQVPSGAGTGTIIVNQGTTFTSASSLTINYAHLNVEFDPGGGTVAYPIRHINRNGSGGYVWQMNTGFDANAAAKASFMRAFSTWRCATGINWTIGANTSINSVAGDGTNVICFDNTSPLPAGVLGTCYSYHAGCISGGVVYWWVDELDIIFDEGSNITPLTWQYGTATPSGSQYDFETVAVHELGHGHQLGHVINFGAIMHYAIANGNSNRSLSANDLAAGNYVQARSVTAFPCEPAMTAYSGCSTLPISVTSLNAVQKEGGIQVAWKNMAETELDHYEVEASLDGSSFTKTSSVQPTNNSGGRADYNWFDAQLQEGNHYYRIKSVGLNGATRYTTVVRVVIAKEKNSVTVYPNPVQGRVMMVDMNGIKKGVYELSLYNAAGQKLFTKTISHAGGNAVQTVNLSTIAAGVYSLRLQGNGIKTQQTVSVSE